MTSLARTFADSATMLRRNLRHQLRYPSLTLMLAGFPIVFLLLFVYVFGGQLGTGLGGHGSGGRGAYLSYVVPGILAMTVASGALGTAISVATGMTGGIIDRFRTMAIARGAVLTGHVIGSLLQTLAVLVVVTGVALTPMFLTLLPFLSSGFVPTATMPAGLRQFAEYEPFTPVTQTVRGLLTGGPIATHAIAAIAWSAGIALASYLWSVSLYNRRRAATPN